ncbi:MAG: DUF421 domain-containing protein [Oscillospiraceae bacterium]|nr:DUF421 domain-containing protein [Oscillospiraceae bacterium]
MSFIRTIILYLVLIFCVRLMGKRQIGQMEPSEFVVTMLVANLAAIPMENEGVPLYIGLIPMLTILGTELVLSGAMLRSLRLRKLLCGKPVILIENGRILQENLRSARLTLDELAGHLREKDVLDIRTVQYAILETNGNLSVFPFPSEMPASAKEAGIHPKERFLPVTVISDGQLLRQNLQYAAKDEAWVHRVLGEYRASIAGTWLLTVDKADRVVWLGKE